MTWDSVKQIVTQNDNKSSLEAIDVILKYCNNIIKNPREPKYRRIRLQNAIVETKLLSVVGAMECLFDIGFLEDGEYLTLPQNSSLSILTVIRDELFQEKNNLMKHITSTSSVPLKPAPIPSSQPVSAQPTTNQQIAAPQLSRNIMISEAQFYTKLETNIQHVLIYEDVSLQMKARSVIPVESLDKEAKERLNSLQSTGADKQIDFQDCLLLELLQWFKTSFFSWVDAPSCDRCTDSTTFIGSVKANPEESRWNGNRVESYRCNSCGSLTRFPRYNHPGKLLETRKGRCGEWANCFTLCCRAVELEARYVLDWTDHVWTEVYSQSQKRWLHCDPCENVCDKPLLYEAGWGKTLTYVIAFSKDDIMDVTWRYSAKHSDVCSRRNECREDWLVSTIYRINKAKRQSMTTARNDIMLNRTIVELVEFLTIKSADDSELSGRSTGSLAWRLARGETGSTNKCKEFIFKLSNKEKQMKRFHVKYNCAKDQYIRVSNNDETTKGWSELCFNQTSLFRKEERDWKMVYLARTEGSSTATLTWKFDINDCQLKIDKVLLKAQSAVYENGVITWNICGDDQSIMLKSTDLQALTPVNVGESSCLTVTASLSKGSGDVAWQHTQLFRQSLTDLNNFPFEIEIDLI